MYRPDRVEYSVTGGYIQVAIEDGGLLPAYWAHPNVSTRFPGIVLMHDWWGINSVMRNLAHLFAQAGHYVIVPDLFDGKVASEPSDALKLVDGLGNGGYKRIDMALSALENHNHCNGSVAAIGLGMGGSLAYEAAILRHDLEAAVSYAGFPQRYLGYFKKATTPILAFYGTEEPYVAPEIIHQLQQELAALPRHVPHELIMLEGAGHDLFTDILLEEMHIYTGVAWQSTLNFLSRFLEPPTRPPERKNY